VACWTDYFLRASGIDDSSTRRAAIKGRYLQFGMRAFDAFAAFQFKMAGDYFEFAAFEVF
jgi:hypothetical protein